MVMGMRGIRPDLERWQLDLAGVRSRMYLAPTLWERERWHALWLLCRGMTASATAQALGRDAATAVSTPSRIGIPRVLVRVIAPLPERRMIAWTFRCAQHGWPPGEQPSPTETILIIQAGCKPLGRSTGLVSANGRGMAGSARNVAVSVGIAAAV